MYSPAPREHVSIFRHDFPLIDPLLSGIRHLELSRSRYLSPRSYQHIDFSHFKRLETLHFDYKCHFNKRYLYSLGLRSTNNVREFQAQMDGSEDEKLMRLGKEQLLVADNIRNINDDTTRSFQIVQWICWAEW